VSIRAYCSFRAVKFSTANLSYLPAPAAFAHGIFFQTNPAEVLSQLPNGLLTGAAVK